MLSRKSSSPSHFPLPKNDSLHNQLKEKFEQHFFMYQQYMKEEMLRQNQDQRMMSNKSIKNNQDQEQPGLVNQNVKREVIKTQKNRLLSVLSITPKIQLLNQQDQKSMKRKASKSKSSKSLNCNQSFKYATKVIKVSGLNSISITTQIIYNLFNIYGEVQKIVFDTKLREAFIQYYNNQNSIISFRKLNSTNFMSSLLKLEFTKLKQLQTSKSQQTSPRFQVFCNEYQNHSQQKNRQRLRKNSPSQVLFVSNLYLNSKAIEKMFSRYGKVKQIKQTKDVNYNKCSYFIKMNSIENAMNTLVQYQGNKICGRRVLLQFTQSLI